MSYIIEFQKQIQNKNFNKFFELWEEYCTNDAVDSQEFLELLNIIEKSEEASKFFGQIADTAIPLWQCIENEEMSYEIVKKLVDLETNNSPILAETALLTLEKHYGNDAQFKDRIRKVGLRTKHNFQGAISAYELLAHFNKGNFVIHTSGWGVGEIMDVSIVREQVTIEFEHLSQKKILSFKNAFNCLKPLNKNHFLVRRFDDPDALEEEAKKDPVTVIKLLLRDIGDVSGARIKDELCDFVIPKEDWGKWWQGARQKLKKDPLIQMPRKQKDLLHLREKEVTYEDTFQKALEETKNFIQTLDVANQHIKEHPELLKHQQMISSLLEKLQKLQGEHPQEEALQTIAFKEATLKQNIDDDEIKSNLSQIENLTHCVENTPTTLLKKQILAYITKYREDWPEILSQILFQGKYSPLNDSLVKKLQESKTAQETFKKYVQDLLDFPVGNPELFFWLFQKILKQSPENFPFTDKESQLIFFENLLVLLHAIEHEAKWRPLAKKIANFLLKGRYRIVRDVLENSPIEFAKEFLLLVSKCHILSDHDKKIMHSLTCVAHPSLAPQKKATHFDDIVWTTEKGYKHVQERLKHISEVEMIENAKEIEEARAHGDLRENAEYKFAQERRRRLQNELRSLSSQLNRARIITPDDIEKERVGIASAVTLKNNQGEMTTYTILGPWDTNPDDNIISFQSKLAQALLGKKIGDHVTFREEEYEIIKLETKGHDL